VIGAASTCHDSSADRLCRTQSMSFSNTSIEVLRPAAYASAQRSGPRCARASRSACSRRSCTGGSTIVSPVRSTTASRAPRIREPGQCATVVLEVVTHAIQPVDLCRADQPVGGQTGPQRCCNPLEGVVALARRRQHARSSHGHMVRLRPCKVTASARRSQPGPVHRPTALHSSRGWRRR
jgi:hypothetical protein